MSSTGEVSETFLRKSSDFLKKRMEVRVKRLYVSALECIEIKFGREFDGYEEIRAKILREGNDAVRDLSKIVDEFRVEAVPQVTTFVNQAGGGK